PPSAISTLSLHDALPISALFLAHQKLEVFPYCSTALRPSRWQPLDPSTPADTESQWCHSQIRRPVAALRYTFYTALRFAHVSALVLNPSPTRTSYLFAASSSTRLLRLRRIPSAFLHIR